MIDVSDILKDTKALRTSDFDQSKVCTPALTFVNQSLHTCMRPHSHNQSTYESRNAALDELVSTFTSDIARHRHGRDDIQGKLLAVPLIDDQLQLRIGSALPGGYALR